MKAWRARRGVELARNGKSPHTERRSLTVIPDSPAPESGVPAAVGDGDHLDGIRRHYIDDDVGESVQDVPASAAVYDLEGFGVLSDSLESVVERLAG